MTTSARSPDQGSTRGRAAAVLAAGYATACYALFLVVVCYAVAFLAGVGVPRTVDAGGPLVGAPVAAAVDMLLLGAFAVQHSVMARPAFKRGWSRVVPAPVERSTYVLAASAVLAVAMWWWHPIPEVVWDVQAPVGRALLWGLFAAGWTVVVAMTFAIDHWDLVGLRQVAQHVRGVPRAAPALRRPLPYRLVRHPMMTGFVVAFLATPTMTVGHLLFALLGCGYILVGVRLEERDLAEALPGYQRYAATTPRFVPRPSRLRPGR